MVKTAQYEVGRYWGKITHQRLGESKSGKPQLILTFAIIGQVNLSDPEGDLLHCPQGERSIYRVITSETEEYALADMDALEWYGNKWSQFDEENREFVSILGKELAFFCKHKPSQTKDEQTGEWINDGGTREEWSIARSGGPVVKPLDAKAVSKLDAMFGKALKGRKPNGTKPVEQKQVAPASKPEVKPAGSLTPDDVNAELGTNPNSDIPFLWLLPLAVAIVSSMV